MNWSYIAGFFDGEGYVYANGKIVLVITQVNREVLECIQDFSGMGHITTSDHRGNKKWNKNWQTSFAFRISKQKDVADFLKAVRPYLIVKRDIADKAIQEYQGKKRISKEKVSRIKREINQISKKRAAGETWDSIGELFDCPGDTIRKRYNWHKPKN